MEEESAKALNIKWEGKATATLPRSTAADVWPLLEDFCNLHKWLPTIDTCFQVAAESDVGGGGVVRHCSAGGGGDSAAEEEARWCRERLTEIDPDGKRLSYEVIDNNMGFKAYESTLKVSAMDGGDEFGCVIEWSFVADPVEGLSCEDLAKYVGLGLQGMARNMERALESALNLSSA